MEWTSNQQGSEGAGPNRRSKFLVFLFSLIPGAGHMHLGCMTRGFQLMSLFFGTLFISVIVGSPVEQFWPMVVAPILWFYSFFDSLQTAARNARGEPVEDRTLPVFHLKEVQWGRTAGWVLIVLGALALLNNLGFMIPELNAWVRRLLGPGVLLGVGAWLLLRQNVGAETDATPSDREV